jgi:hypothetical protein
LDICLLHYDPTQRHFSAELHKRISGAHDKNNFEMMNDDAWPLNLSLDRFTLRQKYRYRYLFLCATTSCLCTHVLTHSSTNRVRANTISLEDNNLIESKFENSNNVQVIRF